MSEAIIEMDCNMKDLVMLNVSADIVEVRDSTQIRSLGVTHHFTNCSVQHTAELELIYSWPLTSTSLLGLTHPTEYCRGPRKYGKYAMNLNRGIDAIYVYSDVIQTKLVGDSSVSLLSVVPIRGVFGKWHSKGILLQCILLWQNMCFPQSKRIYRTAQEDLYHFLLVK